MSDIECFFSDVTGNSGTFLTTPDDELWLIYTSLLAAQASDLTNWIEIRLSLSTSSQYAVVHGAYNGLTRGQVLEGPRFVMPPGAQLAVQDNNYSSAVTMCLSGRRYVVPS